MTVAERMDRLERQNRRLRAGLIALAALTLALVIMGQAPVPSPAPGAGVLRGQRLEIVGEAGRVVVALGATDNGEGFVATYDAEGDKLVELAAAPVDGNGVVSVNDQAGGKLLWLGSTVDGEGSIATFTRAGKMTAMWP